MFVKVLIVLMLLAIIYSLGSAFFFMVKDHGHGTRTVNRLTWRISLSIVLLLAMWGMHKIGWLETNAPVPIGQQIQSQDSAD